MATTNTYKIQVDDGQAVTALNRIQRTLQSTNQSFEGLRNVLGGIAIGAFVTNAIAMADALSDAAKAAGVSTASLIAFNQAVKANGGDSESAINAMGRFSQSIEAAANGSKEMQNRFLDLGITLEDLRTLSEEDILAKLLEGFKRGTAGSQQLAASMAIFGKNFRSVDIARVADDMRRFGDEARRAAPGVDAAGNAGDAFKQATTNLSMALLRALQPISELAVKLLDAGSALSRFIGIAVNIGILVVGFTLIGRAAALVRGAFAGLAEGAGALIGFFRQASNGVSNFGAILNNLKGLPFISQMRVIGSLLKEFGSAVAKNIPGLALLGSTIAMVGSYVVDLVRDLLVGIGVLDDESKKSKETTEQKKREAEQRRQVQLALQGEIDALNKSVGAYQQSIATAAQKYAADTAALRLGEEQKNLMSELSTIESAYLTEVLKLRDQLLAKQQAAANGSRVDADMIPKVAEAISQLTQSYEEQINSVKNLVTARNEATAAANFEIFATKRQVEQQNELMDIQHRMATSTMSEIQKKYADIEFAARKSGKAAIDAEEARLKRKLNPEEARRYYDEALAGSEELKTAQAEEYENSRRFSTGWDRAFREYADNATNAARTAERLFVKATQGMEDALVGFAKTGKFEWKNFVNMMLEELLRAQIQSIFAKMLGSMQGSMRGGRGGGGGGGGGILGSLIGGIGSLFGGGGGQQGPTQSGGNLDGGGGLFGGIGKSIGKFFGGMFANGGTLPAGKFGIVGERGPELISGPATIKPMTGTNVTYNINAVDAQSFKAMIARDPQFLYAVTMQGAKSVPGAR